MKAVRGEKRLGTTAAGNDRVINDRIAAAASAAA